MDEEWDEDSNSFHKGRDEDGPSILKNRGENSNTLLKGSGEGEIVTRIHLDP